jgi:hypothetical protein
MSTPAYREQIPTFQQRQQINMDELAKEAPCIIESVRATCSGNLINPNNERFEVCDLVFRIKSSCYNEKNIIVKEIKIEPFAFGTKRPVLEIMIFNE